MDRIVSMPIGVRAFFFLVFALLFLRNPYVGVGAQTLTSNTTTGVELVLTDNSPALSFIPRNSQNSLLHEEQVSLELESLVEYNPIDQTYERYANFVAGGWKEVVDTKYNASKSFVFSAQLRFPDGEGGEFIQGSVEMQFYVFDTDTSLSVGEGLLPFTVTPDLAKFSLRVQDWPWLGREDRQLEARMAFNPEFNRSTRSDNTPAQGITTFKLIGQHKSNPDAITQVRLVEAVEIDGTLMKTGGVSYFIEDARRRLVMRFAHFTSEVLYDPDVGVLVGQTGGSGDNTSDNIALIVCLAVILPVAAGVVILAGIAIVASYHVRQRRFQAPTGGVELGEEHL